LADALELLHGKGRELVVLSGPFGEIIYSNPTFTSFLNLPADKLTGLKEAFCGLPSGIRRSVLRLWLNLDRAGIRNLQTVITLPCQGGSRVFSLEVRKLETKDCIFFWLRADDITQVQAQSTALKNLITRQTADLDRAHQELEQASKLKDEFLSSMSHELRTPLNIILGMSEALQEKVYGPLNERQLKSLSRIEEGARQLLGLISDILDLSRIGAGQIVLEKDNFQVRKLCEACLVFVKQELHIKSLQISFTIDPLVTEVQMDSRRLKQILINLLNNAVKFTPAQGALGLDVSLQADPPSILFTVWDRGIGISHENQKRLFKPFVQVDGSLARHYSGTGLGLSLTSRLVELHGGELTMESTEGVGSRFTAKFPWQGPVDALPAQAGLAASNAERQHSRTEIKILLAEDNEDNILLLTDYLGAKGFKLNVARSGAEAWKKAEESDHDLILMDIQMPGMDGLQTIRQIRKSPALSEIPIIALTGLAMPGDRQRCLDAGANGYISKPYSLKHLAEVIENFTQPKDQS